MATATIAFFLNGNPYPGAGNVLDAYGSQLVPEGMPQDLFGQGTPGAFEPFTTVNKGSLYREINATDDATAVWMKVAEAGTAADWTRMFAEDHALIGTADLLTAAGLLIEQLEINARTQTSMWGDTFDISAADSEQVVFHAVAATEITEIGILWEEGSANDTGVHEGDVTIGTSTGGAEIVAATLHGDNQASGAYQALSIVEGTLAAGNSVFVSSDTSTGAGTFRVVAKHYLLS